jgi:phospholipid/cholesterol/gamma-HCH transport system permease protein
MSNENTKAEFQVTASEDTFELAFSGDWVIGKPVPDFAPLETALDAGAERHSELVTKGTALGEWDSMFLSRLLQCASWCQQRNIALDISSLPEGARKLHAIATAVAPAQAPAHDQSHLLLLRHGLRTIADGVVNFCSFIGGFFLALGALLRGKSNTRARDFFYFVEQVGPRALPIVTLLSVLMGMILAYMGAIQLRQFGAEIYVANLVAIGTVREMGVLMTGVIMAGRTGAAFAAQLGTMQTNEEIDAIQTLGISPMEFLVTPRILALILVMPLLVIYSDLLGILGGALVAIGMDIAPLQYLQQTKGAIGWDDISSGLIKSVVFAVLIGIAGCQAGLQCGRSSAAVGEATTKAVVTAIVYLVVADSLLNIIFDKLGL